MCRRCVPVKIRKEKKNLRRKGRKNLRRKGRKNLRRKGRINPEGENLKSYFKIISYSIIILLAYLMISGSTDLKIRSIFFNVISILTGTGYVNADFDTWGSFTLILFLGLMFIGGCAGSTTCGVKVFRIQILY